MTRAAVQYGRTKCPAYCTLLWLALGALLFATPATAEILVGVAAPLTGRFAAQGAVIRQSVAEKVAAANASANAAANPPGHALRMVAVNDACEAKAGAEAARKLVAEKVAVVIGHPCGSAAVAAAPIYAEANVILLALTRHPELTEKRAGPTIFRIAGRDDRQGQAIARHILQALPGKRTAIVHDRTRYGRGLAAEVEKALTDGGAKPHLVEGIVAGEKQYTAVVQLLQQAQTEVVVFGGFPAEAAILLHQMRAADLAVLFLGGDALADPDLARSVGITTDQLLIAHAATMGGTRHDDLSERSTMALALWRIAIEAAGATDGAAVAARLAQHRSEAFNFDAKGDPLEQSLPAYVMWPLRSSD